MGLWCGQRSFFKQFYNSITKSEYIVLREGFIMAHIPGHPEFDFHNYMMRTLEVDFNKVVGISWYMWLFVVMFLLFNVKGWHSYFWLSFLPVVLLVVLGAKLEHVIIRLTQDVGEMKEKGEAARVKPSDEHFWFKRPAIILHLIHFILFQNAFELAFFFWILSTYGFRSCIMEKVGFIVPRLIMGVIVQVLCSFITLPLYVLVTQMGSKFKEGMFGEQTQTKLEDWLTRSKDQASKRGFFVSGARETDRMEKEAYESIQIIEQDAIVNVQVLCSYITLPLYILVTQMGSKFNEGMFGEETKTKIENWLARGKYKASKMGSSVSGARQTDRMEKEANESIQIIQQDIRPWKHWKDKIHRNRSDDTLHRHTLMAQHVKGGWKKTPIVTWIRSFFKQFHSSVTKSKYHAFRQGFIMAHCPAIPRFDFLKYMMRTLEAVFREVLGTSWYLWLFVAVLLLLDVNGWNTYFWLSFLPLTVLLVAGAKLEHIIIHLTRDMG
ncbi:MLO-like protein 13 [Hibiscus syriacus]|uniref:MLO-like protein n=1 Tax=Hibiscus syriacus TaxID=106335 RepID=A0A6A2WF80_HIBSY|nr:MLO-like protein 13 [Hibiscus syriacus]